MSQGVLGSANLVAPRRPRLFYQKRGAAPAENKIAAAFLQQEQKAARPAEIGQAPQVGVHFTLQAQTELRGQIARQGRYGAAAAFQPEDLVEIFAIGTGELVGQTGAAAVLTPARSARAMPRSSR